MKDKHERKHRRTHKNHECVRMMANADFDGVPSLAEAMGFTSEPRIKPMGSKISAIRDKLKEIIVTEGVDAGVILLSQESPTYFDKTLNCQVYKHLHFSPLGDALVELSRLVDEEAERQAEDRLSAFRDDA